MIWPLDALMIAMILALLMVKTWSVMLAWWLLQLTSIAAWCQAPWVLIDVSGIVVFGAWPNPYARALSVLFAGMLYGDYTARPYIASTALSWAMWAVIVLWATARPRNPKLREITT